MKNQGLSKPNLDSSFEDIINNPSWKSLEYSFSVSSRIALIGNGGNLAVADHAAIDISRLTNKYGFCPGSGILASSLINDLSHDTWLEKWTHLVFRGLDSSSIKNHMFIGISSSGKSDNVVRALNAAAELGAHSYLISARPLRTNLETNFKSCILNLDEYHSAEVLTLLLTYQLIHSSGFTCPPISKSSDTDSARIDFSNIDS